MNLKKIAKLLIVPIFCSTFILGNKVESKASTNDKDILINYFNSIINEDINGIIINSKDARFNNEEEYRDTLKILLQDQDLKMEKYEIIEDESEIDNKFTVRTYYMNGEITDINLVVENEKVLTGMELKDVSTNVKERDIPIEINISEENNTEESKNSKAIVARWGGTLGSSFTNRFLTTNYITTTGGNLAINFRQEYVSGSTRAMSVAYELQKSNIIGTTTLASVRRTDETGGGNSKQFYLSVGTNVAISNCWITITNKEKNTIKIAGEAYS